MLILSAALNEKIMIGSGIIVTVVEIRNGKVRLGFDVPKEIPVHREKIYDLIEAARIKETEP